MEPPSQKHGCCRPRQWEKMGSKQSPTENHRDRRNILNTRPKMCHRSLENQPRKVELIRPLSLHKRNKHFHSKKLHSRALRGVFWNENANLRKLTGWFDSTLAGRFVVTADTFTRQMSAAVSVRANCRSLPRASNAWARSSSISLARLRFSSVVILSVFILQFWQAG